MLDWFRVPEPEVLEPVLTCPCCGFVTIAEEHDICSICFWQYDRDSWVYAGEPWRPNYVSLLDGQRNYATTGSSHPHTLPHVRKPWPTEMKDPLWRPLDPARDPIRTSDDNGEEPAREPYWLAGAV